MKFIRFIVFALFFAPFGAFAAPSEFQVAAQLLAAAKNADIQQVQILINNGANINYVDSTGLSLVCTALMNNDLRAAQILQMYGADASQCDRQIKNYKTQNSPGRTGGLFGGLSTAQGLTLAAAGAAVIIGGLYLLTDVFDHDNHNHSSSSGSSGGSSGGSGGSSSDSGTAWVPGALPYGPAMINATQESTNYANNLALYYTQYDSENEETPYYRDFYIMNHYTHNYLLLMRGYSALARGYLGLRTLRNSETHAPIALNGAMYGSHIIEGGRPVNVALITANGVNASDESSLRNKYMVWTGVNANNALGGADSNTISSKYYNDKLTIGTGGEFSVTEDPLLLASFDLSGVGTAIHNGSATADDNLLGKIVGGGFDNPYGDFAGFMPNGQMTIYRTGGGKKMISADGSVAGAYDFGDNTTIDLGDTMTFESTGVTATVSSISTLASNDDIVSIVWSYGDTTSPSYYYGYLMNDLYYVDFDGDGMPDVAYLASGGDLLLMKQVTSEGVDYYNYTALKNAATRWDVGDAQTGGRSRVDVIANADVIEPLHSRTAPTIDTMKWNNFDQDIFGDFIASTYGDESTGTLNPRSQAEAFFSGLGSSYKPLAIFSTGASIQNPGSAWVDEYQVATFENAAPLVYDNLEHLFMSIVAVASDTSSVTSISPNSDTNPDLYTLSQWYTTVDGDVQFYKSRICGFAGQPESVGSSIDPWCFAAVGVTDEMAVASAAGAVGALRSAFYYMTPQQIFTLLALTADGPYLNRLTSGTQLSEASLAAYLRSLYDMSQFTTGVTTDAAYLEAFKQVYGYGVINLERATTPGTNLYYYTDNKIVSSPKNAYWRAAVNTGFRASSALNLGRAAVNLAAYDMLESIDGSMRLPRIWENNVSLGADSHSALYMGDVLTDLRVRESKDNMTNIGNMSFGFTRSERAYNDGMGGLDDMRLEYAMGDWKLNANYQRYLTDRESRFYGMANPILALASRATTGGVEYDYGKWSFGARAFSGAITDEGLLENDPTISSLNEPLQLGTASGAQSEIGWGGEQFGFKTSFGSMYEDKTVLGAYATGLLEIGNTNTNYIDMDAFWKLDDMVKLRMRATFAHTSPDTASGAMVEMSEFDSNAFAFGADIGNVNLGISLPLAVYNGRLSYDYANYEIVDTDDGLYDLAISDFGTRHINMSPAHREVRLSATYRHNFGPFTDGAIGFIYRINPNNTHDFGNESIFMMKMSHLLGI